MQLDKQLVLREHFQLIRVLGQGSFGKVYLIRNKKTKKQYALKRYNRTHLQKRNKYKNLIRSILILQQLNHPAIIKFINYIVSPDQTIIYLLYECCKKGSLQKLQKVLLDQAQHRLIKYILFQLADALKYIKSMNMAHRDIKPSNITFNSEGQLKLIDFDEAVCFDQRFSNLTHSPMLQDFGINLNDIVLTLNSRKSRASSFVGTQIYMSPEMIHSTIGDEKGDLWAFGCIIYQLYVGQYLHIQFEDQESFHQQVQKRFALMRQKKIDERTINFFASIIQFNPKDRLDIQQVSDHQFFNQLKQKQQIQYCKQRLIKILRGNYGLLQKATLDACQMQLIGISIGKEIFQHLVTVILVRGRQGYEFYNLIGGGRYFKLKNIKEPNIKLYLTYNQIDLIQIQDSQIAVSLTRKNKKQFVFFKHLYPQMLKPLYQLMNTIFRD